MQAQQVLSRRDLEALERAWSLLQSESTLPSGTHAWAHAAAEVFHPDGGLWTVAWPDLEGAKAIAPLVRSHSGGVDRLEFLGVGELSEPTDFVYTDRAALDALAAELARLPFPLRLERLPATSRTIDALKAAYARRGVVVARPQKGTPYIALDPTWREPQAKLSSRRRSDLRRARRRAEELGDVTFEFVAPTPDEVNAVLDTIYEVESQSWRAARGGSMTQDPIRGPFFRAFAVRASRTGIFRAYFLRIKGRPAAMQYAVECGGSYSLLKIGFDEEFKRCSPGMLLTAESIRRAAAAGLDSYELLGVIEDWTSLWTNDVRPCVAVHAYPLRLRGAAALLGDLGRMGLHKLQASLPGRRSS